MRDEPYFFLQSPVQHIIAPFILANGWEPEKPILER